jgi:NADH:ubiquinone oxidoreductase subunit C
MSDDARPALSPEQQALADRARSLLGGDLLDARLDVGGALVLEIPAARNLDLLAMLKRDADPPVSYLSDLHGVDGNPMSVVYHLFRPGTAFEVLVRAFTPRSHPAVPSVMPLWHGAWWPEREVMEMFGIDIIGHPDPRKLLLPDDWHGFPLRKDYVYPLDHPYLAPDPLHENPIVQAAATEDDAG